MNDSSPHHNGSGEIREIPSLAAAAARSGDGETVLLAIQGLVRQLGCLVFDSKQGIPTDLFYFVSRMTPLVNVDLLIRDEGGRTLLICATTNFTTAGTSPAGSSGSKNGPRTASRQWPP